MHLAPCSGGYGKMLGLQEKFSAGPPLPLESIEVVSSVAPELLCLCSSSDITRLLPIKALDLLAAACPPSLSYQYLFLPVPCSLYTLFLLQSILLLLPLLFWITVLQVQSWPGTWHPRFGFGPQSANSIFLVYCIAVQQHLDAIKD